MLQDTQRQIEHMDRKIRILARLAEASAVLNSTLHLDRLLQHLMDVAAEITGSEDASVLLWNGNTNQLFFAATTTSSVELNLIGQPVPLEGSIAGSVLRERQIVQVGDVSSDPRHFTKVDEEKDFVTRSLMGVPMTSKDRPIGVLEVLNKRELPWTDEDSYYLSILAAQAAVAIEGAQLVMALRKANQELKEVDKLKNDFIAIASHELRTPLGVILGYASFLQETRDEEVSEHATKVMNSALQLRTIIESLTNLGHLKHGEADLQRTPTSLTIILQDAQRDVLGMAQAQGHRLDLYLPVNDVTLNVDHVRLSMALTNVLNNAVRFTPYGGHIVVKTEQPDANEVWITVTDNGIGIPQDQLERIFDEFYQIEDHMTRVHGGLGIGLSIAKALVAAHGGRIWASSPGANQGATFTIALPVAG